MTAAADLRAFDIDLELVPVLAALEHVGAEDRLLAGRLVRLAWWLGYVKALEDGGAWAKAHGYALPRRAA